MSFDKFLRIFYSYVNWKKIKDHLTSSFLIFVLFLILFLFLVILAGTSNTILHRNSESGHLHLVSDIRKKGLNIMLVVVFWFVCFFIYISFIRLRNIFLFLVCWEVFCFLSQVFIAQSPVCIDLHILLYVKINKCYIRGNFRKKNTKM